MKLNYVILIILVLSILFVVALLSSAKAIPTEKPNIVYPDPKLTPGDVLPNATAVQICVTGYTKTVRDVSLKTKKRVYDEYKVEYPQKRGSYEVDHFIPLELGGSNDIKNLFLEPAEPRPGFHEKDIVENYLHDQVCNHNMDLHQAQEEIRVDWYKVYESIPNKNDFNWAGN